MSRVNTWKGNEFIALASDTNFDFPVGGFYSGYYAMMVQRHMYEFGTTVEQMAMVSVKNHANALHNPYAQKAKRLTIKQVRESPMVATPLTMEDICTMSDGAAVCLLASEELAGKVCDRPVRITGVGSDLTRCGWPTVPMARSSCCRMSESQITSTSNIQVSTRSAEAVWRRNWPMRWRGSETRSRS